MMMACTVLCALGFAANKGSWLPSAPEETAVGFATTTTLASEGTAGVLEEQERYNRLHQHQHPSLADMRGSSLQVQVTNHYQRGEDSSMDLSLYPWEHVAEPHRETTLELTGVPEGVQDGANIM